MTQKASNNGWWRGGVIYQIYPRSFQDSNGDGIGDLPGITQRLDHIAALGADAIWLSPFFKSPMKDFGYDVSDYNDVDPMFGTLDDFKALVQRAHALGLKVMIDQVLSHCSDQHPWFTESRASRDNPKADWFVWADARPDGTPPNNWLSVFGGSAWQWDTRRRQYYLHNFLSSQPDLNFHNPAVQDALLAAVKFWLELGVDGYRLDAINFCFHDAALRDNPGRGAPLIEDPTAPSSNPYSWQHHRYDKSQPEALGFLRRLRSLVDRYDDTTMVGEIGDDDGLARVAEYTAGGDKLHMAYCFDLLGSQKSATFLHALFSRFLDIVGDGWPCWALSNHDVARVATRWGGEHPDPRLLRLAAAFQLSLRGTVCLYQGEELGLGEADVPFEALQDPYGITFWPNFKGRDGCRTPLPWIDAPLAGFTTGKPWLPIPAEHQAAAVAVQAQDPHSVLSAFRSFLAWRRTQPALLHGDIRFLDSAEPVLLFERMLADETLLLAFNLSAEAVSHPLPAGNWQQVAVPGPDAGTVQGNELQLPPRAVYCARRS
mgnify:CR=1 FL=1